MQDHLYIRIVCRLALEDQVQTGAKLNLKHFTWYHKSRQEQGCLQDFLRKVPCLQTNRSLALQESQILETRWIIRAVQVLSCTQVQSQRCFSCLILQEHTCDIPGLGDCKADPWSRIQRTPESLWDLPKRPAVQREIHEGRSCHTEKRELLIWSWDLCLSCLRY